MVKIFFKFSIVYRNGLKKNNLIKMAKPGAATLQNKIDNRTADKYYYISNKSQNQQT